MSITIEQAQASLASWIAADQAVAKNQSYSFETAGFRRQVTRADAAEIRRNIIHWNGVVERLERGGMRVRGAVPV